MGRAPERRWEKTRPQGPVPVRHRARTSRAFGTRAVGGSARIVGGGSDSRGYLDVLENYGGLKPWQPKSFGIGRPGGFGFTTKERSRRSELAPPKPTNGSPRRKPRRSTRRSSLANTRPTSGPAPLPFDETVLSMAPELTPRRSSRATSERAKASIRNPLGSLLWRVRWTFESSRQEDLLEVHLEPNSSEGLSPATDPQRAFHRAPRIQPTLRGGEDLSHNPAKRLGRADAAGPEPISPSEVTSGRTPSAQSEVETAPRALAREHEPRFYPALLTLLLDRNTPWGTPRASMAGHRLRPWVGSLIRRALVADAVDDA